MNVYVYISNTLIAIFTISHISDLYAIHCAARRLVDRHTHAHTRTHALTHTHTHTPSPRTLKEEAEVRLEEDILKGVALRPSVSSVGRGRKHLRKQQHDNKVYIQSELNYLKRSTF